MPLRLAPSAAALAALLASVGALGNGRFPNAQHVWRSPADGTMVMRATWGFSFLAPGGGSHWSCEDALGYGGEFDPAFVIDPQGGVWLGLYDGLARVAPDRCGITRVPALTGANVVDLDASPDGRSLVAVDNTPFTSGNAPIVARIWRSDDGGARWTQTRATLDDALVDTIEMSRSDVRRLYVTAREARRDGVRVLRSDDGGDTLTSLDAPWARDAEAAFLAAVAAEVLVQQVDHGPQVAAFLDVDLEQVAQVVLAGRRQAQVTLLLDAGRLGVALGDDDAAQVGAVLAGHVLPGGLAQVVAEVDLAVGFSWVEEDAPAVLGHLDVVEVRPALRIDAGGGAQVDVEAVRAVGAHVLPPLQVVGLPALERALLGSAANAHACIHEPPAHGDRRDALTTGSLLRRLLTEHVADDSADDCNLWNGHCSPLPRGLLKLLRLPRALVADALQQPVAICRQQLKRVCERNGEARAAVLLPAELKEAFAPDVQRQLREELLRAFLRSVLSRPGRKNPRLKGSSTSWTEKHVGHSISIVVSTPQSTRSNSSTRKSASRIVRSSRNWRLPLASTPSISSTRYASTAESSLSGAERWSAGSFRSSSPVKSLNATLLPASGIVVSKRFPPTNAARLLSESLRTGSFVKSISQSMRARQLSFRQETPKAYSGP